MRSIFTLLLFIALPSALFATTQRYRLMFNDDPATTITIGWEQVSGTNPTVYYGTTDHGSNWASYPNNITPYQTTNYMGMTSKFAKITGLTPNTAYYFCIKDSDGTTQSWWFKTCPDVNTEKLSFVSGGDSRSGQTQRQNSNRMVAKIRPHAVLFGGDLVNTPGNSSVQTWFDDWQLSITSDNQMIPLVHSFGNHEDYGTGGPEFISELFDTPYDVYYNVVFGGDLFSMYTLNGELLPGHTIANATKRGQQTTWLNNTLSADNSIWKAAQYHRPIVPHYSGKGEGADEFDDWAWAFYNNGVRLVMESDAHVTKLTDEVKPAMGTASGNSSNWFTTAGLDPGKGITFTGEGAWGTIRTPDDSHPMTSDMTSMYQFAWIIVDKCKMEIRTIDTQSPGTVPEHSSTDLFSISAGLDAQVWKPSSLPTGVRVINLFDNLPDVDFIADNTSVFEGQTVNFTDQSTNSPTSWDWTFGDGGTSTNQNPSYVYSTAGSYSVTLEATNGNGSCEHKKTDYILVSPAIPPVADFIADDVTPSVSQTVNFTDLSTNNPTSWSWDFGDGGNSTAQHPTHSYGAAGLYTVTLTATNTYGNDTEIKTSYIDVQNGGSVAVQPQAGNDDAEEETSGGNVGNMYLTSSDLEIGNDGGTEQIVGVRFPNVAVPQGATISNAYIKFQCDEMDLVTSQLNIYFRGEDIDDAPQFSSTNYDISNRTLTNANTTWSDGTVPGWNVGSYYDSPSVTAIIQEIVDRPGWTSGNAMAVMIWSDPGETSERISGSFEGGYAAPELIFDWSVPTTPAPVADFTAGSSTVCEGENVTFMDQSTNSPTSWLWDFGDGNASTVQNPSHSYSSSGTYTVSLTATNSGGSDAETFIITVNASPTVTTSSNQTICAGDNVTISASGATTYNWDNSLGSGASHSVSPNSNTTYTVTGTTSGCSDQATVTISVDTQADPGTSSPITACINDSNLDLFGGLIGEDSGGSWSDDDATGALSGNSLDVTGLTIGNTYSFTYSFSANGVCPSVQTSTQVTVSGTVEAGNPTSSTDVCNTDANFDLFNTISGHTTGGTWNDDDATGALSGNEVDGTSLSAGTYDFTYSVSSTGCGSDQETVTITVGTPPTVTATGTTDICEGESTTISASGATTYDWDNGVGTGASHSVSPATTTTYTVTGTENACIDQGTVTITVNPLPTVTMDAFEQDTLCSNEKPFTLPNGDPAGGTYSGNGVTGTEFNPTTAGNGTHTVTYTFTDGNGCTNAADRVIVITDCLGIFEGDMPIFSIYPNPTHDIITIERENPSEFSSIKIFDMNGKIVYDRVVTDNPLEISVEEWSRGAYTIQFTNAENNRINKKILIQ